MRAKAANATQADFALTMDLEDNAEYRLSFETLQSLRHLADKVLPLIAFLQASITTIERIDLSYRDRKELGKTEDLRVEGAARLSYYSCQLQGNLRSAEILQQRVQGILDLVRSALNVTGSIHKLIRRCSLQMRLMPKNKPQPPS